MLDRLLRHFPAIDAQMEWVRECCQAAIAQAIGSCLLPPSEVLRGNRNKVLPGKDMRVGSLQDSLILQEANALFVKTIWPFLQPAQLARPVLGSATRAAASMVDRQRRWSYSAAVLDCADRPEKYPRDVSPQMARRRSTPALEHPTPGQMEAKRLSVVSCASSVGPDHSDSEGAALDPLWSNGWPSSEAFCSSLTFVVPDAPHESVLPADPETGLGNSAIPTLPLLPLLRIGTFMACHFQSSSGPR